jgi:hypothetical protein
LNKPCAASWKVFPVAVAFAFAGKSDMPLIVPIGRE